MNKEQFLFELKFRLNGLPQNDIDERVLFYSEMIDDRMEDGLSEEEAVAAVGSVDEIVDQVMSEIPLTRIVKEKVKQKQPRKGWEIALLILGFPLWFPLLIAAFAVCFSLYITLWAVLIGIWAADLGLAVGAVAGVLGAIFYVTKTNIMGAIFVAGSAVALAGFAIFMFAGCVALSKAAFILTKKIALGIKTMVIGKGTEV
jgi:uncharacterized membrane protein